MTKFKAFMIILAISSSIASSYSTAKIRKIPSRFRGQHSLKKLNSGENEEINDIMEATNDKEFEVCETMECRQLAKVFSETLEESVDPCVDFYEFSCGGWEDRNPIPKYEHSWDRYKHFESLVEDRIREELEAEPKSNEILPVRKARRWYHSCMDFETREARGIKPIESLLRQIGGWPMIMDTEEWNDQISWQKVDDYYVRITGKYTFHEFETIQLRERFGSIRGTLVIVAPKLPLDDELPLQYRNYTGDDLTSYRLLIEGTARLFIEEAQADVSDEQLNKDIDELIKFEKTIYTAMKESDSLLSPDEKVDEGQYRYGEGLDEFIKFWNNQLGKLKIKIDWRNDIQRLFDLANVKFDVETPIEFGQAEYYYLLLKTLESTDQRTIVNYIHWKFVSKALKYTIDEAKDIFNEIVKDEYGVQERPPRWRECVREIEMADAVSFIFVEKYFQRDTAKAANKMMENIRKALEKEIRNSNWMTADAKEAAIKKANKMKALIGFPDWYNNKTAIVDHYKGLIIGYDYLDNILSFMRYKRRAEIRSFVGYEKNAEWVMNPITVNAVYLLDSNILTVPAVDFQSPLFGSKVPDYVNYGIAGSTIGHEMGHGFDPDGIRFGVEPGSDLLDDDMIRMYYQRSECFVKQYNRYFDAKTIPPKSGKSLENEGKEITTEEPIFRGFDSMGALTVGENIADLTGVQTIFDTYMEVRNKDKPNGEVKLPGFEKFTDEQMFFIAYAAQWCEVSTKDFKKRREEMPDPHSPSNLRVIGPVSNTQAFAKAFNCSRNTPMNPENKCDIWKKPGAASILKSSRRSRNHRHYFL